MALTLSRELKEAKPDRQGYINNFVMPIYGD